MASSKAQIKASNKYNKEHYAKVQANINKDTYNGLCAFCHVSGMSKTQLISNATQEYVYSRIQNGDFNENQVSEIAEAYNIKVESTLEPDGTMRFTIKQEHPAEDTE